MDTAKLSLPQSSKAPHVNNGDGSGPAMDEAAEQRPDRGGHKDPETAETDVVDGFPATAETLVVHQGPADVKQNFHSMGYHRRTNQKVVTDFATLSKGTCVAARPRAALKQVLFSQAVSDKNPTPEDPVQVEVLKKVLEAYLVPADLSWVWEEHGQAGTKLEASWTDIVRSHPTMSKIQRHQQEALWEFVHTELSYINKLFIINELVIAALVNLHQHGFLLEVTPRMLFFNLPLILNAHCQFWQEVIYPMLQEVRMTGMPFDPRSLEAGCLQFSERFASYQSHCVEHENTLEFARRQMDSNPYFLVYLKWVETHPQCGRMRLGDMQAKPHQRITKYPLLLKAVLKNTLEPHIQQTIRGMLSCVNGFLETINDYLRFMDEELALSISAQRIEGYEIPGINEEIDKHVREICHFDLTRPVVGVGPRVVRTLLLEENLKMRGRKDNKLEVVALLFSDVLLMTKVQKKAGLSVLKVVCPPLTLESTSCVALKDGYSFLLVEGSELGCAMNVKIFMTATAESCSTWVSTIQQAKDTLKTLREAETSRQLDSQRSQPFDTKPFMEASEEAMVTIKEPIKQSAGDTFVDKLSVKPIIIQSGNGLLKSSPIELAVQPSSYTATTPTPGFKSKEPCRKSGFRCFPGKPLETMPAEWIEMQVKKERVAEEVEVEFQGSAERKATWNHHKPSASLEASGLRHHNTADPLRSKPKEGQNFFLGNYPEVDYPMAEPVSPPKERKIFSDSILAVPSLPISGTETSMKTGYNVQFIEHKIWKDPGQGMSTQDEDLTWRFSRKLKSPRLRRRRPNNHQADATQAHGQFLKGLETVMSTSHTNSSSNSDSDSNHKLQVNFKQNDTNNNTSHRVLKLGCLKMNPGFFWDSETFSEPELPQEIPEKRKTGRSQRSASIPGIHELHYMSERSPGDMRRQRTHTSPVKGLLERAKVRVRREGRNGKAHDMKTLHPPPSPSSLSAPMSPFPSDGEREVELMRHRLPTVSQGWREQLVDGDAEDKKYSNNEVNVDWHGWCFDDEEVMDYLGPTDQSNKDTGMLEDINRTLTTWHIKELTDLKVSHV